MSAFRYRRISNAAASRPFIKQRHTKEKSERNLNQTGISQYIENGGRHMLLRISVPNRFQVRVIPSFKELFFRPAPDIHYIGGAEILPPPLPAELEAKMIAGLGKENDEESRKKLVEHNLRLVVYIAKKFDNTGIGVEDLISIGTIGLIKAIQTFNPEKNINLATYASRCIENEILMFLRRNNKTKLEVSIDEPLNVDWDGNELLLSDILGTDEDEIYQHLEDEVDRELLGRALARLSSRERTIIQLRFGINTKDGVERTQKEVADLLGISQSYISRLEKKIMKRLRKDIMRWEGI